MNILEIVVLFAVMVMLALVPSTSVALVIARSSTAGFLNGAAVSVGIVLGDLIFVFLAIFGMTALAEVMGGFFLILRYMAGAYLIWFGISLLRSKARAQVSVGHSASTLSTSFLAGLILTLGDVKAILFYASLFPAFVDLTTLNTSDVIVISLLTVFAVGGVKLFYAYSASKIVSLPGVLKRQKKAYPAMKIASGGVLVGAGVYLIMKT
ncbi:MULTISPECIES: LysE family translocator [Nitrincola]|uniref:Leucine efflux protein n=1 Tax=Nitrincola nitratireducens TaxID=1229521 RepID=W9UVP4_9GAMM|nr:MULTISPECIES: LysE family translocator [Nitrincola]EXJ11298.1 Leucine efflux protein [Nitrincola nitratireducens]